MKHLRRLLAAFLAAALLSAAPVLAAAEENLEHFQPVNTYTPGTFRDVPASSWYAEGVEAAYELGLMQGTGKGEFEPGMIITLGETVALAARIHSIYHTGTERFVQFLVDGDEAAEILDADLHIIPTLEPMEILGNMLIVTRHTNASFGQNTSILQYTTKSTICQ